MGGRGPAGQSGGLTPGVEFMVRTGVQTDTDKASVVRYRRVDIPISFEPRFTVTHAVTANLTRIERARGFLEAAALSEDWIRQMGARALVLEAHHTTHIEEPSSHWRSGGHSCDKL